MGHLGAPDEYVEQVRELRRAIGYEAEHVVNAAYLAWIGAPRAQVEALAEAMGAAGFGGIQSSAVAALAVLDLAEGHYRDAHARLKPLIDEPFLQVTPLQYPDFVEAAVRGGHPAEARGPVEILEARADANGSAWTPGVAARSRALITPDPAAEASYREAIDTLGSAGSAVDLARAELLYGEWLRRRRRRREARPYLRSRPRVVRGGWGAHRSRSAPGPSSRRPGSRWTCEAIPGFDLTHPGSHRRSTGRSGTDQRRDRLHPVHQRQHRRLPPAQGVPEARDLLAPSARRATAESRTRIATACTTRDYAGCVVR